MENKVKFKVIEKFVNEHKEMELSRITGKSIVIEVSNRDVLTVTKERGLFGFQLLGFDKEDMPVCNRGFKKQKDVIDYLERKYK